MSRKAVRTWPAWSLAWGIVCWSLFCCPATSSTNVARAQSDEPEASAAQRDAGAPPTPAPSAAAEAASAATSPAPMTSDTAAQQPPAASGDAAKATIVETQQAKELQAIAGQQEAAVQRQRELEQRREELEGQLQQLRQSGLADPPPYKLGRLDQLRRDLEGAVGREGAAATAIETAADAVEQARATLAEKESVRRRAKEATERQGAAASPELLLKLAEAEQASKLAQATFELRQTLLASEKLAAEVQQLEVERHIEEIARVSSETEFAETELAERLAELDKEELELQRQVAATETNLQYAQQRWNESRRELDESTDQPPALVEEVEAWRLARRKRQEQLAVLNRRLARVATMRLAWDRRWQAHNTELSAVQERQWADEAAATVEALGREAILADLQLEQLRKEITAAGERQKQSADSLPDVLMWLRQQKTNLSDLLAVYQSDLDSIAASQALHESLGDDLRGDGLSPRQWLSALWQWAVDAWHYEVSNIDDRGITIGKIVTGLLLLVCGWFFARLLSAWLERRLRRRMWLNADAAAVFRKLTFYGLVIAAALIALRVVNVPLTVFTVIGGGLAIGVGLGSQNLVNNFISGLVLLAERPMRLGERVVYGGYDGIVEEVGFRCTKVRTTTGALVTVPNSMLLNEPVENIGRRPYVRRMNNIKVPCDTSLEKVKEAVQILRDILDEPGIREKINPVIGFDPHPPRVFFNDFNADSLNIAMVYWFAPPDWWSYMEHAQKVNLRILEEFERAGIELAFPSQTVYLAGDQKRQLALQMLAVSDEGNGQQHTTSIGERRGTRRTG